MLGFASVSDVSDHAVLVGNVDASSVRSGVSYVSGDSSWIGCQMCAFRSAVGCFVVYQIGQSGILAHLGHVVIRAEFCSIQRYD